MPTTIRTSDPRELLALVPFQLGFRPVESAVLVSIRGDRGVGLIARVDLADLRPGGGGQLARALVSHLVGDGARRAVVVVYTAEDLQDPGADGIAAPAVAMLRDAAGHHLGEVDCWVVGPGGYYGLGCVDPACCPSGGRSLDDLQGTRVGAQMVLEGVQVARTRDDLVRIAPASAAARKAARRARVRWEARYPDGAGPADAHRWRREGLELWRGEVSRVAAGADRASEAGPADGVHPVVFGGRPPDVPAPTLIGRLQAALGDVLVRDAVLLTLVPGGDRVADEVVALAGADVGRALRSIIDPAEGKRPDPALTGPARTVLEQLVAHGPRQGYVPALTLLAVLAWWEGDGARAGLLVDRALLAAPGYRLAVLVDDALRLGMPPGWVRART